jgi:hypothetical protein
MVRNMRYPFANPRHKAGAAAVSVFLSALPAAAEDYPYSGLFWIEWQDQAGDQLDLRCALSYVEQQKNGDWFAYHVDLDAFRKTGTVSYRQIANGHCTYDPTTKVEACASVVDRSYPEGEGTTVFDIVVSIEAAKVDTRAFPDPSALTEGLKSPAGLETGIVQTFLRCPYPEAQMLSLQVPGLTDLSPDELGQLRSPSAELLLDPSVKALAAKLRLK